MDEALAVFASNVPGAESEIARAAYRILLSPEEGFQKKAAIDMEGVRTVLQLRSKFGMPRKSLIEPAKYYDPIFHEAAMRR